MRFCILIVLFCSQIILAGNEEFFQSADDFLDSQTSEDQEPQLLGHRYFVGPQIILIQDNLEPNLKWGYLRNIGSTYSLGLGGFLWLEDPSQFSLSLEQVFGNSLASFGAWGLHLHWFQENLSQTPLVEQSNTWLESFDWGVSTSYLKELQPWSDFYYFPRFELELGWRHQAFAREAFLGSQKVSHFWIAAHLGVTLFQSVDP